MMTQRIEGLEKNLRRSLLLPFPPIVRNARALFLDSSRADLYHETTMPPELRKAHEANDKAVLKAYGFSPKASEEEIVAALMKLYSERTSQ